MIQGLHHISMKTSSEEEYRRVTAFYGTLLKLPKVKECAACVLYDTGAGIVEVFRDGTASLEQGVLRHYAFAAADVDACIAAVRAAGYAITVEPKDVLIGGDEAFPARVAFCKGPLGEDIEFFCQRW